ncbi:MULTISPECIES: phosphotransferase family protein [Pseudomonas]|uniref:Phosphotransferase family protein n=1 Tax=Pseudomonas quercus TaxID=2722792 RepID=A0ABX0YIC0_9PSED|nr:MULTISPECIES: phosphotransferase family protein [Pseudomonas]MBF7143440.1 phosphotransferase family protein [Pseudomonas sp. LY10J]NJP01743.1 phosphotransferase family protein [Pseudomonas quercus]
MALTDPTIELREGEELDIKAVDACLKAHLPSLWGVPVVRQFPGGASNLTYLLSYPDRALVLRRPPLGRKAHGAHDMRREYHVLKGLVGQFDYSPHPVLLCTDDLMIGTPFYVMERLQGVILRKDLPAPLGLDAQATALLCKSFVDRLVELHQVDYRACGLESLGRPEGYVQRQIASWSERYTRALTPDAPGWQQVMTWLQDKCPGDSGRASLIHNDYRFDNVIVDTNNPVRISGVLDWELATVGDPLMDLGNCLAYWVEAGDPEPVLRTRRQPSNAPGMLTRAEMVAYYAERAGVSVGTFDFYYVQGLFRLAGIVQQLYYRYYHRHTRDPRFAHFVSLNTLLEQMSLRVIHQSNL